MPENWKTYKLGDLLRLNYGKSLTTSKRKEGNIPVFSSSGRTGWHNHPLVKEEGIIVGRKGTVGSIFKTHGPFYCIDTAYYILRKDSVYNFDFLFYLLHTIGLEKLNFDSAVPGLNRNIAYDQEISLPPIEEQRSIASILSALDDKIELNLQMNKTLEEMAGALYKHWFVDFGPFQDGKFVESELGIIPAGWEVKTLDDLGNISYGKMPKKVLLADSGFPIYSGYRNVGWYPISNCEKGKVIIVARGVGGTGDVKLTTEKCFLTNLSICIENNFDLIDDSLLFFNLKRNGLDHLRTGSAQPQITINDLKTVQIVMPIKEIQKHFLLSFMPLLNQMESNLKENQTLTSLRDTLLPKLISGEVRVKEAEKILTEAL